MEGEKEDSTPVEATVGVRLSAATPRTSDAAQPVLLPLLLMRLPPPLRL